MLNAAEGGLLIEERRRRICEFLRDEGRVTVDALANHFGTSQVTIRADLSALETAGVLVRTHGGAVPREGEDEPLGVKQLQHHAEKVRIAHAAVALIRDGETIILDSGTTTAEIARALRKADLKSINVITNALNVAALLMDVPSVRLIVPGAGDGAGECLLCMGASGRWRRSVAISIRRSGVDRRRKRPSGKVAPGR